MKWCILSWLVAVAAGAGLVYHRRDVSPYRDDAAIQYQATRPLVANHRIVPTDLDIPPNLPHDLYRKLPDKGLLAGHYVVSRIERGDSVYPGSVNATPDLKIGDKLGALVYPLDAKPQLADLLDAGSKVSAGGVDADVTALICGRADPQKAPPCYAVLAVPADKADALWKSASTLQVVPRSF
jgi:hypothetical protein